MYKIAIGGECMSSRIPMKSRSAVQNVVARFGSVCSCSGTSAQNNKVMSRHRGTTLGSQQLSARSTELVAQNQMFMFSSVTIHFQGPTTTDHIIKQAHSSLTAYAFQQSTAPSNTRHTHPINTAVTCTLENPLHVVADPIALPSS